MKLHASKNDLWLNDLDMTKTERTQIIDAFNRFCVTSFMQKVNNKSIHNGVLTLYHLLWGII